MSSGVMAGSLISVVLCLKNGWRSERYATRPTDALSSCSTVAPAGTLKGRGRVSKVPKPIEIPGRKEYASRAYKTSGLTIRTPPIEEQSYETLCCFLHGGTSRRL